MLGDVINGKKKVGINTVISGTRSLFGYAVSFIRDNDGIL